MTKQQISMIDKAALKFGPIVPVGNKTCLADCFTEHFGRTILWVNTKRDTGEEDTHTIMEKTESQTKVHNG